jgi:thiamine kinase-like enzyme
MTNYLGSKISDDIISRPHIASSLELSETIVKMLVEIKLSTCHVVVEKNLTLSERFIYGTVDQQLLYGKIFAQFWNLREKLLKEKEKMNNRNRKLVTCHSDTSCTCISFRYIVLPSDLVYNYLYFGFRNK